MTSACILRAVLCATVAWAGTTSTQPSSSRPRRWIPLDRLVGYETEGKGVQLRGVSGEGGGERILRLGFVSSDVVRLHGAAVGDFSRPGDCQLAVRAEPGPDGSVRLRPADVGDAAASVVVSRFPLTLAVKDRQGRERLRVTGIALDPGSSAKGPGDVRQVEGWRLRLRASDGEAFYGFGERFNAVNQRGQTVQIWGVDAGMGSFLGIRATAYKNSPFFISSRRYALFWDSSYRLDYDVGASKPDEVCVVADGPIFDVYAFCHEDPKASLTALSDLTGRPLLPPRWAFAPWMGREAGAWRRKGLVKDDAVGEMLDVVKRFERLDIPHTAIYAEGPGAGDARLYHGLRGTGIRVFGWHSPTPDQWGNVKRGVDKREVFKRVLLRRRDGSIFTVPRGCFRQGHAYFDFTDPETLECIRAEFRDWLKLGLAGTMVDDGDDVPIDAAFHNGETGRRMHNRYHYHYHRTFHQVFREARGDDFVLFARAAGPGCQRFVCFFAGDHPESFDGLESVIHGGLSFGASGFPFWGSDVGGLLPRPLQPLTAPVYMRWVAFAALSPLMRCHGCSPREPWWFGQQAVDVYKQYAWLRMNLLPTIYSLAVEARRTGVPLMRLAYLEFPDDVEARRVERAYCFGPDLWFVPVTTAEATSRVYLPGEGAWTDLWTGETLRGGRWVERPTPYGREPLLLRRGAILLAALEDRALRWGRSMTPGKRSCVVATATNEAPSRRTLHLGPKRSITVESRRSADVWTLSVKEAWPDVGGFVVYAAGPRRVEWSGRRIVRVAEPGQPTATAPVERWWYDETQRSIKVIVRPDPTGQLRVVF